MSYTYDLRGRFAIGNSVNYDVSPVANFIKFYERKLQL